MIDTDKLDILLIDHGTEDSIAACPGTCCEGFRTIRASSFEDAMEIIENRSIGLMIVNMDMPGFDSSLTDRLRNTIKTGDLNLIVLRDGPETAERSVSAYELGAVDVMFKPVHHSVFKNKIMYFTELHRQKQAISSMLQSSQWNKPHVNRTIADLAGGIAHQFNNTLNIITGNVELLKMDFPGNSSVRSFSTAIFDSVKKMTALTDKLLAYARAGRYSPGQVDLNKTLVHQLSISDYASGRVLIQAEYDQGDIQVEGDESQLKMIFSALMKNAMEAIPEKGVIKVRTRYLHDDDTRTYPTGITPGPFVCLSITDNGQGMTKDVASRMFEPFFSTKFQGRGLDLAAVQGIVINHGGWIDVQSKPGEGTTVNVFLPVTSYHKTTEFYEPDTLEHKDGTILVIDDDDSVRDLTLTMLRKLGYQAISASTGFEAVEIIRKYNTKIDLALLDIEMPDMNGTEIYPHLLSANPDIKVIICSGYSLDGPAEELIRQGAQVFMQKPFSFGELANILRKLIERRKHKRFGVKCGHVIITGARQPLHDPIVDISKGGVAVRHKGGMPDIKECDQLSIVSDDGKFTISGIPFEFIPKKNISAAVASGKTLNDRQNIRFGPLDPGQAKMVEYFITHFTL